MNTSPPAELPKINLSIQAQRVILCIISIIMFMEFLDTTIINTAIPSIAKDFLEDPLLLKFSVTSYFLSLAIFIPMSGWCADHFGTLKVFLFSVGLFLAASLLCGLSTNVVELTCFRFLQGMGGAFMNPVCRIVLMRIFPPKELVRVQGIIFTPAMLGFVLGPFLGGVITTYLSWHWIFYVNIPVGLIALYFGYRFIPQQKEVFAKKFDVLGFLISGISLGCLSFSIDMIGHYNIVAKNIVIITGFIGVSLFVILILYCFKKINPILDFSILKIKTFRIGLSSCVTMYMMSASIAFLLPLMYQEQFGYTPLHSGFLILAIACGQLVFRSLAPCIISKFGFKNSMLFSCLFVILSVFLIARIYVNSSLYYILFSEFLFGSSIIIFFSATGALNYIDIPKKLTSPATSFDLTSRQFFSSLGIGVSSLFINFFRQNFTLELSSVGGIKIFHYTFFIMAFLGVISLVQTFQLSKDDGSHALKH